MARLLDASRSTEIILPRRIARFLVREELGRGGQGITYRAYDPTSRRQVALKVIPWNSLDALAADQKGRWERESRYLVKHKIAGVVKVRDSGEIGKSRRYPNGAGYIAYDLVGKGQTLRDLLASQPAPGPVKTAWILKQVHDALDELHDRKLYHRDIKPNNIAFRDDHFDQPVLIDFGISRAADTTTLTLTGGAWGSPLYAPPELSWPPSKASANPPPLTATDVYSFARTAAVAWAVSIGVPLPDAERMGNEELRRRVTRELPSCREWLRWRLAPDPQERIRERHDVDGRAHASTPDFEDVWLNMTLDASARVGTSCSALERVTRGLAEALGQSVRFSRLRSHSFWGRGAVCRVMGPGREVGLYIRVRHEGPALGLPAAILSKILKGAWKRDFWRWVVKEGKGVGAETKEGFEVPLIRRALARLAHRSRPKELLFIQPDLFAVGSEVWDELWQGNVASLSHLISLWRILMRVSRS